MNYTIGPLRSHTFYKPNGEKPEIFPIQASTAKIEAIWRGMTGCYIGPGGVGQKGDKYDRAKTHLQKYDEVWMPLLAIWDWMPDRFRFNDGRHTFAAMRDLGYQTITIGVPADSVDAAVELLGNS